MGRVRHARGGAGCCSPRGADGALRHSRCEIARRTRALICGVAVLAGAASCLPARGAELHLDGGGKVVAERYWIDGDWIYYEGPEGTIGLPRSLVLRIDREVSPAPPDQAPPTPRPTAADAEPESRTAELSAGRAAIERRDFAAAFDVYRALLDADPSSLEARVACAASAMALGRLDRAQSLVLEGLVRDPERAELYELLGDVHDRAERLDDAVAAWREAARRAPGSRVDDKLARAERELVAGRHYDLAGSARFNLRFDGDVDRALAAEALAHLELEHTRLSRALHHAPPQAITVVLYPTREFRDVTAAPEWVAGLYDGKIRVPLAGLGRLDPRSQSLLTHELTHAFVHSRSRGRCPRWLHEGLAQWMEGRAPTRAEHRALAERVESRTLFETTTDDVSYAAALSMTSYLASRRGLDTLARLLARLGEGIGLDNALREVYSLSWDELRRQWAGAVVAGAAE